MKILNDQECGWIKDLNKRTKIDILKTNRTCDFLIVGAGFTGMSAARKLAQIHKNKKIILIFYLLIDASLIIHLIKL